MTTGAMPLAATGQSHVAVVRQLPNVLLVEDDAQVSTPIHRYLAKNGFDVNVAPSLLDAAIFLEHESPSVILLDIVLPDGNGLDLLKQARVARSYIPIIVVSALGSSDDQIRALQLGADDFIAKPVHLPLLVARIDACLRMADRVIRQPLLIDQDLHLVSDGTKNVRVSNAELRILMRLAATPGTCVPRSELQCLWSSSVKPRTVDYYVCCLRRTLVTLNSDTLLRTERGGYSFAGVVLLVH